MKLEVCKKSDVDVTSTYESMKKAEVEQSKELKYKSYQSLLKWYDVNSIVKETIFIFTWYTLTSPLTMK